MNAATRIVLASGNRGKLREMTALLRELPVELAPQSELSVTDVEETGATFVENAILKARHAATLTGLPAIADDSGIEVDVLGGAPGIRSARYAGDEANDERNLRLLLERVAATGVINASARFQCLMVYMAHGQDPTPVIAQGTWHGHLIKEPRGENGFGYDPIFFVPTHGCTSAQLDPAVKNQISHRAQAMAALLSQLRARFSGAMDVPSRQSGTLR